MTPAPQEPARVPRAAAYARSNQGADHYRQPPYRRGGRVLAATPQRGYREPRNRKRFWLFTVVLLGAVAVAAATVNSVFAGPSDLSAEPPARRHPPRQVEPWRNQPLALPPEVSPRPRDPVTGTAGPPPYVGPAGLRRHGAVPGGGAWADAPVRRRVTPRPAATSAARRSPAASRSSGTTSGSDDPPVNGPTGQPDNAGADENPGCDRARQQGAVPAQRGGSGYPEPRRVPTGVNTGCAG